MEQGKLNYLQLHKWNEWHLHVNKNIKYAYYATIKCSWDNTNTPVRQQQLKKNKNVFRMHVVQIAKCWSVLNSSYYCYYYSISSETVKALFRPYFINFSLLLQHFSCIIAKTHEICFQTPWALQIASVAHPWRPTRPKFGTYMHRLLTYD